MWNMIQGSTCSFTLCIKPLLVCFLAFVLARATKMARAVCEIQVCSAVARQQEGSATPKTGSRRLQRNRLDLLERRLTICKQLEGSCRWGFPLPELLEPGLNSHQLSPIDCICGIFASWVNLSTSCNELCTIIRPVTMKVPAAAGCRLPCSGPLPFGLLGLPSTFLAEPFE